MRGELHDPDLAGVLAFDDAGHAAFVHDEDAIAHAQNFRQLGGNHHDRHPLPGEFGDQPVDLRLGADIDAARRLVENENARLGHQPPRDQHLLLIAAGEVDARLEEIGRAHAQLRLLLQAKRFDLAFLHKSGACIPVAQDRRLHVLHDVEQQEQAALLAILGEEAQPRVHRRAGGLDGDLLAIDEDLARGRWRHAEQRLGDVAASRADKAGRAQRDSKEER